MATTSGLFRFSDLFLRVSQHFKSSNGKYILKSVLMENFLMFATHTLVNPFCEFTISFSKVLKWRGEIRVKRVLVKILYNWIRIRYYFASVSTEIFLSFTR